MKVFGEDEQFLSVTYYNNGVKTETWEYLYWESNGNTKQLNIYYGNGKLKEVIEYNEDGSANREIKYDENGQTIEKRLYWENGNVKEETYRTATNEVIRQYGEDGTKLSETRIFYDDFSKSDR